MKLILSTSLMILCIIGLVNAQESNASKGVERVVVVTKREKRRNDRIKKDTEVQEIIFNFKDKGFKKAPPVAMKEGQLFRIKIENINQNLYKISLSNTDTVLSKRQETPTFGAFNLDAISKVVAGLGSASSVLSPELLTEEVKSVIEKANKSSTESSLLSVYKKSIKDTLDKHLKNIETYEKSAKEIARSIDDLKLKVYLKRLNSLFIDNTNDSANPFGFRAALEGIQKDRANVAKLAAEISKSKEAYEKFSKEQPKDITGTPTFASMDNGIRNAYTAFLTALASIEASISADKTYELLAPVVSIENNTINTYTSLPMQFMGERTMMRLSITPRNEGFNLHSYFIPITFPTKIRQYTSIGISFYGATIYDRAYSTTETIAPDSSFNFNFQKNNNVDKTEIGLAAILRYGTKINYANTIGVHGSIGAGIPISTKIRPRVLIGLGSSFGNKHMLTVDAGMIVGSVELHNKDINTELIYRKVPSNLTVSKIDIGFFGAIGYLYQF